MRHRKLLWVVSSGCFSLLNCFAAIGHAQTAEPRLPAATAAQAEEFVDTRRLHWAYQALNLLCQTEVVGACSDTSGKTPLTRRQFARTLAPVVFFFGQLQRASPSGLLLPRNTALVRKDVGDAIAALWREFKDELVFELGIAPLATTGSGSLITTPNPTNQPARGSQDHPVLSGLAMQLWPLLQKAQPGATFRLDGPLLRSEVQQFYTPVAPFNSRWIETPAQIGPKQLVIQVTIGSGDIVSPLTIPQEVVQPDRTTYINCYDLGIRDLRKTEIADGSAEYIDTRWQYWVYEALNNLVRAGIIEGYSDGTFRGNRPMTRYEAAVAIARILNVLSPAPSSAMNGPVGPQGPSPLIGLPSDALTLWKQHQSIAALRLEFAPEIAALGSRVETEAPVRSQPTRIAKPPAGTNASADHVPGPPAHLPAATSTPAASQSTEHAWLTLTYGKEVDPKLVEQIKQVIADYAAQSRELAVQNPPR
jgi:hypothetical protein